MTTLRSIDDIVSVIHARRSAMPESRLIVGIVGAPGSGKSTVAVEVVEGLGSGAAILPMDGFHLAQATLVELGRRDRMGAPDTFDVDGLVRVLDRLVDPRESGHVPAPGFGREREEPEVEAIDLAPDARVIVLEGNYLLLDSGGWERVAAVLDVSFSIEIDRELRLERLIARHERYGKSPEAARAWALGPDEANARLIEATERRADYRIALG